MTSNRFTLRAALPALLLGLAACGGGSSPPRPSGPLTVTTTPALSAGRQVQFQVTLPAGGDIGDGIGIPYSLAALGTGAGFATGGSSCATTGVDYIAPAAGSRLRMLTRSATLTVEVCANASFEPNETFELQLTWEGGTTRAVGTILNDAAGGLNDTGITQCLDATGALVACSATTLAGQDGANGRDANALTALATDGRVGFAYRALAAGCVEDRVTGLTWDSDAPTVANQAAAQTHLASANSAARCGFSDWRLPTTEELLSLVDGGAAAAPRIDATFASTPSAAFWTGTAYAGDARANWVVDFASGAAAFEAVANPLAKAFAVRLVRGGTVPAATACDSADDRFTVHGDGTVTDTRTGLMWQQCTDGTSGSDCATGTATAHADFAAALARATTVNADKAGAGRGHGDWRVPNRNELASLVNRACEAPAISRVPFPATRAASYWSSSPAGAGRAWYVDFNDGSVALSGTTGSRVLRLVRAGQ